jgi:hypothetical protein
MYARSTLLYSKLENICSPSVVWRFVVAPKVVNYVWECFLRCAPCTFYDFIKI